MKIYEIQSNFLESDPPLKPQKPLKRFKIGEMEAPEDFTEDENDQNESELEEEICEEIMHVEEEQFDDEFFPKSLHDIVEASLIYFRFWEF